MNPIRAGVAKTPEESDFTSAQDRIRAQEARKALAHHRRERDQNHKGFKETVEQKEILD